MHRSVEKKLTFYLLYLNEILGISYAKPAILLMNIVDYAILFVITILKASFTFKYPKHSFSSFFLFFNFFAIVAHHLNSYQNSN